MTKPIKEHFQLKQTIVTITAFEAKHIEAAKSAIRHHRYHLEEFIQKDPFFMLTLEPYDITVDDAPDIVKKMVRAGSALGLGPMSAVAGTIAKLALDAMIDVGAKHAIVDNGGDIAIINAEPVLVGIYAGASPLRNLALEIPPSKAPLGICTSSGNVGPSISFGCADAAIVISDDVSLADAAATALGNAVNADVELSKCFAVIDRPEIDGALIIRGDELALWGNLPEIKKAQLRPELITRA
jgi:ApbE superfamily uncharacterized protein (UPF0280 family)